MPNSITKAVVRRIAQHFKAQMPELKAVNEDFPSANEALAYPALSITVAGAPEYRASSPWLVSTQPPNAENKVKALYQTGIYQMRLQLDFWCANKEERHRTQEAFYQAFASQFPVMGLSLNLPDYYGIICRYELSGYDYGDSESAAQRREWRLKVAIQADCLAILERDEFAVVQAQIESPAAQTEDDFVSDIDANFTVESGGN